MAAGTATVNRRHDPARLAWRWAWLGAALGLVVALVLFAPARWLASLVQQVSQGRLLMHDARGTVWNGSAQLTLTGGVGSQDAAALPGRLSWQLTPGWLGAGMRLRADCCMPEPLRAHWQARWNGWQATLSDNVSQWPAEWLVGLGTPWNTLQVRGALHLSTQGLNLAWAAGRLVLTGQAQLDALNLSSQLSTLQPMGSYRFSLQGGASPTLAFQTLRGRLQLSGSGQWVGGQLRVQGEATAEPQYLDALSNLLNLIGRRDGARSIIKIG